VENDVLMLRNGERKGDVYLDEADFEAWLSEQMPQPETPPSDNHPVLSDDDQAVERTKPKLARAQKAIVEKWPNGAPSQMTLSNELLCRDVVDHLKQTVRAANMPSDDTILRAAGRRK
jgi:hypothetical protein